MVRISVSIIIGITLCVLYSCGEVFTLVTQRGEKPLRAVPLSPRPGPRVLVFAIDGAGYPELMQALHSGKASHLQTLLGAEQQDGRFAHGYAVPNALSILPSTTVAA